MGREAEVVPVKVRVGVDVVDVFEVEEVVDPDVGDARDWVAALDGFEVVVGGELFGGLGAAGAGWGWEAGLGGYGEGDLRCGCCCEEQSGSDECHFAVAFSKIEGMG